MGGMDPDLAPTEAGGGVSYGGRLAVKARRVIAVDRTRETQP